MSISGSLSNALSGLTAAARAAEVVSSNVANAMTEGYGRREIELTARSLAGMGAGVQVKGITRNVDQALVNDRRLTDAALGQKSTEVDFLSRLESAIGLPGEAGSLSERISSLSVSLIEAASRPESEARLQNTLRSAQELSNSINEISDEIQNLRMGADDKISSQVTRLNDALASVQDLNGKIASSRVAGRDASALLDQRQQLIDGISSIIPLREIPRDHDQIALYSIGGAILLDGNAAQISFSPVGIITPDMTLESGALSGLSINGKTINTSRENGPISGGSLAALFVVRDTSGRTAQIQIDAVARDLIERFQDPSIDPTLAPGSAGLFTDGGVDFDALNEEGIAARLSVNSLLDPKQGGEIWRIRAGIGATDPGETGDGTLLQSLSQALETSRIPSSGGFMGAAVNVAKLSADFLSLVGTDRQASEINLSFAASQRNALKTQELEAGVDTDHELQRLLQIEQSYAANARVVSTVDEMIQTLLGL